MVSADYIFIDLSVYKRASAHLLVDSENQLVFFI